MLILWCFRSFVLHRHNWSFVNGEECLEIWAKDLKWRFRLVCVGEYAEAKLFANGLKEEQYLNEIAEINKTFQHINKDCLPKKEKIKRISLLLKKFSKNNYFNT